jgi:hypothetical protein
MHCASDASALLLSPDFQKLNVKRSRSLMNIVKHAVAKSVNSSQSY